VCRDGEGVPTHLQLQNMDPRKHYRTRHSANVSKRSGKLSDIRNLASTGFRGLWAVASLI
jgi:hypothetical protein